MCCFYVENSAGMMDALCRVGLIKQVIERKVRMEFALLIAVAILVGFVGLIILSEME